MGGAEWRLVGRDEELELLAAIVGDQHRSVVVAGAVGVGKSRLVGELLTRLEAAGRRSVMVRVTRSTATIPFGPFAAWAPDRPGPVATDRLQMLRGIAGEMVADGEHAVVAVDDAHLLDDASAALVLHLVAQTSVCAVVTVRSSEPSRDAIVALWKDGLAERVDIQALSETETGELVEHALGGPVGPTARRRLWELTEGTPLYLREVVRAALGQGVLVREAGGWRWRGTLAGSARLHELVGDHVDRASPDAKRLLELVALGEPLPLTVVSELAPSEALAAAEQSGLLAVDDGPAGTTVRLAHPLYGEILRTEASTLSAGNHRRQLAATALAVGWQDDPLRVATWLIDSGTPHGDPGIFMAAADRATNLTDWELARRMAEAAEASGAGGTATLAQAAALLPLERWDDADRLLASLIAAGDSNDDVIGEAARLRASLLLWRRGRPRDAIDVDLQAAARLPSPARARVLAHAGFVALFSLETARAARLAADAVNEAGPVVGFRVQGLAVATLAWTLQGRVAAALGAAEMALPHLPDALDADLYRGATFAEVSAVMPAAYCLALCLDGRIGDAVTMADMMLDLVRADEARLFRALVSTIAGRVALLEGHPDDARRHASVALATLDEAGAYPPGQWAAAVLATGAAQLGDRAAAAEALGWAATSGPIAPLYGLELTLARAWLAMADGQLSAAQRLATDAAERARAAGASAYQLIALLDLARLGAPHTAAERLSELAQVIDGPFAPAAAAYARSLAAEDGLGLDALSTRFEDMGAMLLAAEAAANAAAAHGAMGLRGSQLTALARARTLAAATDPVRTPALRDLDAAPALQALTDREREVAELAARGLTNRQIAERLYVSMRTVHTHLHRAYAKLGINDRNQLTGILPSGVDDRPDTAQAR